MLPGVLMSTEFFYQIGKDRLRTRVPDQVPQIGDFLLLKRYGKIRIETFVVNWVAWHVGQDESPQYVNKPRMCVIDLKPAEALEPGVPLQT